MTAFKFARAASFLCAAAAAAFLSTGSARAAMIVNIEQIGLDVVATYSGTLDYSGFIASEDIFSTNQRLIYSSAAAFSAISAGAVTVYDYGSRIISAFGTGGEIRATSLVGDTFRISWKYLYLAPGFVSGSILSGSMTFAGATHASLGLTAGTVQTVTLPNDTITIAVIAPVPLPAALPMLGFGLGALGLIGARKRRRAAA